MIAKFNFESHEIAMHLKFQIDAEIEDMVDKLKEMDMNDVKEILATLFKEIMKGNTDS